MTGIVEPYWIPERIADDGETRRCRWVDVAGVRYNDPFFETTLARRRRQGATERWSSLQDVHAAAVAGPALTRVAFVFHVSRCGSTLFSQLFGLDSRTVVLSEVPVLDQILRSDWPDREPLFAAALRILGRSRFGEDLLIVKTDCWHLFHADALRRLYPQAPFIMLYRAPDAVLDSHRRMRGMHMVPGLATSGPRIDYDSQRHSLDGYAAQVLERYCAAMLDFVGTDKRSLLVSYDEGSPDAFLRAARWLGIQYGDDDVRRIEERGRYHAKRPDEPFGRDGSPRLADVDLARLGSQFADLERQRHRQAPA